MWPKWVEMGGFEIRWIGHGWLVRMGSSWSLTFVPYDNHEESLACAWPTALKEQT